MEATQKPFSKIVLNLDKQDLPVFRYAGWNPVHTAIAAYFRQLMEMYQTSEAIAYLQIPSIMELADFFACCETDVFEALFELKQQAYNYEVHGLNCPVRLRDPLMRKPTNLKYYIAPLCLPQKGEQTLEKWC